jgi:hypothetical protein
MRHSRLSALLLGLVTTAALAAEDNVQLRLNQIVQTPDYRDTWQQVVKKEERLPDWIINLSGEATPMVAVKDKGKRYLTGKLCEPQQCATQRLYAVFSWDKDEAYALYVQVPQALPADKAPSRFATRRWLGDPDPRMRQLLEEQLSHDTDWY